MPRPGDVIIFWTVQAMRKHKIFQHYKAADEICLILLSLPVDLPHTRLFHTC